MSSPPPDIFPILDDLPAGGAWYAAARDVTYISSILKGTRGSNESRSSKEHSRLMKLWSAISFILSTGDADTDVYGSKSRGGNRRYC